MQVKARHFRFIPRSIRSRRGEDAHYPVKITRTLTRDGIGKKSSIARNSFSLQRKSAEISFRDSILIQVWQVIQNETAQSPASTHTNGTAGQHGGLGDRTQRSDAPLGRRYSTICAGRDRANLSAHSANAYPRQAPGANAPQVTQGVAV